MKPERNAMKKKPNKGGVRERKGHPGPDSDKRKSEDSYWDDDNDGDDGNDGEDDNDGDDDKDGDDDNDGDDGDDDDGDDDQGRLSGIPRTVAGG